MSVTMYRASLFVASQHNFHIGGTSRQRRWYGVPRSTPKGTLNDFRLLRKEAWKVWPGIRVDDFDQTIELIGMYYSDSSHLNYLRDMKLIEWVGPPLPKRKRPASETSRK